MRKIIIKILFLVDSILSLLKIPRGTFLWKVNGVLLRNLKTDRAKIDGHIIHLDSRDSLGASLVEHEPKIRRLLKENIKQGDIVVDIGANIGYHTLLMAKLVGPKGKVYAFEPEKENFELLKKNIERNGYQNVVLVNKGLGEKEGVLTLYLNPKNKAGHSVFHQHSHWGRQEIEITTLDDFLPKNTKVDLIKMDIEGAEYAAIKGMRRVLSENNVKVISEFCEETVPLAFRDLGFNVLEPCKNNLFCFKYV